MSDEFLDGNTSDLGGNTPFGDNTPGLGDDFGDDSDDVFGDDFSDLSQTGQNLSLIHISEPTRLLSISYAVFCLKKKKKTPP